MRILHIAYSLSESSAATRLAKSQSETHQVSFFLGRLSTCGFVRERQIFPYSSMIIGVSFHLFEALLGRLFGVMKGEVFSFGIFSALQRVILRFSVYRFRFDVFHLHWGGYGFCPLGAIEGVAPVCVITAHDYHFFTGGCHIPMGCDQFRSGCVRCPLIRNKFFYPVVSYLSQKKIQSLRKNKKVIALSTYSRNAINGVIGNIDIQILPNVLGAEYPSNEVEVDEVLRIFTSKEKVNFAKLVIVGVVKSNRDNKGLDIIRYVTGRLKKEKVAFRAMVVGQPIDDDPSRYINYGNLQSSQLAQVYAMADLCLVPSRYETFSQVTLESISCCTPVVAFDLTGPKDIVEHGKSGFLVPAFNKELYYTAVKEHLNYKRENLDSLRSYALKTIKRHSGDELIKNMDIIYSERSLKITTRGNVSSSS